MGKPEIILAIENHCKINLNQKNDRYSLSDYENRDTFEVNDKKEIVGLNISNSEISDFSILKCLTSLNSLHLESNEIEDISF